MPKPPNNEFFYSGDDSRDKVGDRLISLGKGVKEGKIKIFEDGKKKEWSVSEELPNEWIVDSHHHPMPHRTFHVHLTLHDGQMGSEPFSNFKIGENNDP